MARRLVTSSFSNSATEPARLLGHPPAMHLDLGQALGPAEATSVRARAIRRTLLPRHLLRPLGSLQLHQSSEPFQHLADLTSLLRPQRSAMLLPLLSDKVLSENRRWETQDLVSLHLVRQALDKAHRRIPLLQRLHQAVSVRRRQLLVSHPPQTPPSANPLRPVQRLVRLLRRLVLLVNLHNRPLALDSPHSRPLHSANLHSLHPRSDSHHNLPPRLDSRLSLLPHLASHLSLPQDLANPHSRAPVLVSRRSLRLHSASQASQRAPSGNLASPLRSANRLSARLLNPALLLARTHSKAQV